MENDGGRSQSFRGGLFSSDGVNDGKIREAGAGIKFEFTPVRHVRTELQDLLVNSLAVAPPVSPHFLRPTD